MWDEQKLDSLVHDIIAKGAPLGEGDEKEFKADMEKLPVGVLRQLLTREDFVEGVQRKYLNLICMISSVKESIERKANSNTLERLMRTNAILQWALGGIVLGSGLTGGVLAPLLGLTLIQSLTAASLGAAAGGLFGSGKGYCEGEISIRKRLQALQEQEYKNTSVPPTPQIPSRVPSPAESHHHATSSLVVGHRAMSRRGSQ